MLKNENLLIVCYFDEILYEEISNIACRCSIVVSIPACHAGDPGSIPGNGEFFYFSQSEAVPRVNI